jgi:hypothetical protein
MAKGYWLGRIDVKDVEGMKQYASGNPPIFKRFGGRYLVRKRNSRGQFPCTPCGRRISRLCFRGCVRQGVPPHATYLFKHALIQDAAYGTLLREPRRALHARIAETIEGEFPDIAENQPEILARHCNEAGLFEKAR